MHSELSARALTAMLGGWRTREPAYEALADGIRLLCLDNRIAARTGLPAERELAAALGVSRSTIASAYASLRATAHIESLRGSGSVTLPLARRDPGRVSAAGDAIDLQQASPAAWPGLPGIMAEVAADAARLISRAGYDVLGQASLRAAIAADYSGRGIPTTPDQVMVTTGAQAAIHLVAAVLVGRGDAVAIETPTYPHAAEAFRAAGGRLVGVPVTTDAGWDLDRAAQAFARTVPVAAYLMPAFQNPTGRTMTTGEEGAITDAASRAGTILVIDETTADLALDPGAPRTRAFADAGRRLAQTIRIGSLGKTVWGGLRVGWIRADPDMIRRLVSARPARDLGTPEFEQAVALKLFGHMPAVRAQRAVLLREGRDALAAAVAVHLPEWHLPEVAGGVSLWTGIGAPLSSALVLRARSRGLLLSAGPRFGVDGGNERHLRLPFTSPPAHLERGVEILAELWPGVRDDVPVSVAGLFEAVV